MSRSAGKHGSKSGVRRADRRYREQQHGRWLANEQRAAIHGLIQLAGGHQSFRVPLVGNRKYRRAVGRGLTAFFQWFAVPEPERDEDGNLVVNLA